MNNKTLWEILKTRHSGVGRNPALLNNWTPAFAGVMKYGLLGLPLLAVALFCTAAWSANPFEEELLKTLKQGVQQQVTG